MAHHHPKNISAMVTPVIPQSISPLKAQCISKINLNLSHILGEHQNGSRKKTCSNQITTNTRVSSELIQKVIQNFVKKDVCSPLV
jgi:hypothetical protein